MTFQELRNIIVKQLYAYLDGPKVVLSDQVMPESDYPFIYYQSIQQRIPGPFNITDQAAEPPAVIKTRSEHAQATFSFTACGINRTVDGQMISGDNEALDLADRAQGFFLWTGRQLLSDMGVVVIGVENTQNRSALDVDEVARRYGFDVLVRYERTDTRTVQTMELPVTY